MMVPDNDDYGFHSRFGSRTQEPEVRRCCSVEALPHRKNTKLKVNVCSENICITCFLVKQCFSASIYIQTLTETNYNNVRGSYIVSNVKLFLRYYFLNWEHIYLCFQMTNIQLMPILPIKNFQGYSYFLFFSVGTCHWKTNPCSPGAVPFVEQGGQHQLHKGHRCHIDSSSISFPSHVHIIVSLTFRHFKTTGKYSFVEYIHHGLSKSDTINLCVVLSISLVIARYNHHSLATVVDRNHRHSSATSVARDHRHSVATVVTRNHRQFLATVVARNHRHSLATVVARNHLHSLATVFTRNHRHFLATVVARNHRHSLATVVTMNHHHFLATVVQQSSSILSNSGRQESLSFHSNSDRQESSSFLRNSGRQATASLPEEDLFKLREQYYNCAMEVRTRDSLVCDRITRLYKCVY